MQQKWLRRVAFVAGLGSAGLALAVLVGWHIGYLPLIQVFPAVAAPMQRLTALGFLISGAALIILTKGGKRTAAILQSIVLVFALLILSEYLFAINLGIDELFGRAYVNTATSHPGRPSPITALCFAVLNVAMLAAWNKMLSGWTPALRGIVGSVVAMMGSISFFGYIIGHTRAYGWGQFTRVAPHTGIGFVLLGMGVVAVAWQEQREPGLPKWFPISVTLAVAAGVLGLWQALIAHEESHFARLSFSALIGGFVLAILLGITVYLAQKAWERNRDLLIFRMAFDNSFDGLLLTRMDGSVQKANPSACAIFGRTEEEICQVGRGGLIDTSDPRLQKIIEDRKRWGVAHGEINCKRKDESLFPIEISSVVFTDTTGELRTTMALRDISERKKAESQLRLQTERLSLATRAASIGVWEWDVRTNQSVWDDTCYEIYGVAKDLGPMSYDNWKRLVHPDDLEHVEASLRRTIELQSQDYVEFRIVRPDGAVRYITSAEGVVLDEQGQVTRMVGVNIDVTEQRRMQAQLEASARLSSLGMMAGGIAHEINNPLTIIHASASDLLDAAQDGEQLLREDVVCKCRRIRDTADRIASIVKSLRRIAREGSQDEFFPVAAAKIVGDTLEMCRETFKSKSVTLILPEIDPSLTLVCREVQVAQVLLNLLQNALDAVADEPGERWVRLEVSRHNNALMFAISDSGPGVPAELKSKIMEPFFTTKDVGKGTGLGLSLSTSIAEEHGGKLELTDKAGHTCFCLTLPITTERSQYAVS